MTRFSKSEIKQKQLELSEWQTPEKMNEKVGEVSGEILFTQAGTAFLREGWIAAELGRLRGADQVRVPLETFPDFQIRFGNIIEDFEATEVDDPNRRRGDEYKTPDRGVVDDPYEDWVERANGLSQWLRVVCQKKASKNYYTGTNLAIYLNVGTYGTWRSEIQQSMISSTESVRDKFSSVWVLWEDHAYQVWPDRVRL
ncbi:hypothetical protein [Amorphus sp. 3PC139-8]|uniref:hypothetical protein n=1 Tax=Amorphus sp. 3PC139-8 TaxID=2735676 RepID=UPI00345C82A3